MAHALDLLAERVDVLEAAIHRGEAHVRDLVEMVQLFHRQLADQARGTSRSPSARSLWQMCTTAASSASLDTGRFSSALSMLLRSLLLVERLAARVVLDDARHHQLRGLEGREALAALQALAATADLLPFAGEARIDDLRLFVIAERAMHAA